ncbi:MAG: radical SAM protein, partial [Thermoproteota archaeon]
MLSGCKVTFFKRRTTTLIDWRLWRILRPDAESVMFDDKVRLTLGRYISKVKNQLPSNFMLARRVPSYVDLDSEGLLWEEHEKRLEVFRKLQSSTSSVFKLTEASPNFLDLKIKIAEMLMRHCVLCEHRCGVNRMEGQKGRCRAGTELEVSSLFDHYGEEPELVPSFTVFTMGCSFKCLHCQNYTISQWLEHGTTMSVEEVARIVDRARRNGSRNLNCVGGNPDQYLYSWLRVFKRLKENVPIVWNSNAFYSLEQAKLLFGCVDVYLLDFKYGNNNCAKEISGIDNYFDVVSRNHLLAFRDAELIIRILVLPEHLECCLRPIVNWVARNLSLDVRVNLMWQYRPEWRANERKELRRRLTNK